MRPAIRFDRESIRIFIPQEKPTVYRLYDAEDRLLYIGASAQPRKRLLSHKGKEAAYVELQFFKTTTAMARAEKLAIQSESTLLDCGFGRRHASWKAQRRTS